jgi:hypothetical protein
MRSLLASAADAADALRRKAAAGRLNWDGLGDIFFHIDDAKAIDAPKMETLVEFELGLQQGYKPALGVPLPRGAVQREQSKNGPAHFFWRSI